MEILIMKNLKICFLTLVLFTSVYSQEVIETKKQKVDSLFTLTMQLTAGNTKGLNIKPSENNLKKAKELLYFAYAHAIGDYKKKSKEEYEKWKAEGRKDVKPNLRMKKLEKALKEKYGDDYVGYLKTSYFMKIKILDITKTKYPIKEIRGEEFFTEQIDVKVKILDVLKGENYYTINDVITISYLPIWFQESGVLPNFEIGYEYALPLNIWKHHSTEVLRVSLHSLETLYRIEADNMYSPLLSETDIVNSWSNFKEDFLKKYIIK
jgi:hypothetical protein